MIVVEFYRVARGVERNVIGSFKISFEKTITTPADAILEVVVGGLDVLADLIQCDDGFAVHRRRRIDFANWAIVRVTTPPRS